ncbi:hypothetical protein M9H77_18108 [Catharanthus roseus]|uniref:Uncharacterized protein n=1 Tax=Catharanthus roseus TaxID=4058 RepID=A0ACC0B6H5_CATRO|nr:hypothetical protein M9H77_18108 [Catharanthus roseus]
MKTHSDQGYSSGYDLVLASIRGLHCTWLVPRARASSVLDSGEWIHLKRAEDRGGCSLISLHGHRIMIYGGTAALWRARRGSKLRNHYSAYKHVDSLTIRGHSSVERQAEAAVDLVAGLGALVQFVYYFTLPISECEDGELASAPPEWEVEPRIELKTEDEPTFQTALSKIAEVKYPDCDIYVVILFGDLIALPFEGYGVILGMDCCLNITLRQTVDGSWLSLANRTAIIMLSILFRELGYLIGTQDLSTRSVSRLGRVHLLEEGCEPRRVWPNRSTWTPHHALRWDGRLVESQEGLETKVGPRVDLINSGRSEIQ